MNPNTIRLKWRERNWDAELGAFQLSDGTLRFICLATLLLQPEQLLPSVVVIDEPELGLHPYGLVLLAGMLRSLSRKRQVIIGTQSIPLLDELTREEGTLADVIVVDRRDDGSLFRRLDPAALADWREEYSASELWEKGVLGGSPLT